ncbi:MAG: hypothetical protein BWX87_01132 [Bacteroidetes bacterium ADurb.Bin123]|jgi:hypothetical protein|nr:MAG: hypothetical protein BWX87_01132 [Bacteroidetes bacterium ADurb.Bin123]
MQFSAVLSFSFIIFKELNSGERIDCNSKGNSINNMMSNLNE